MFRYGPVKLEIEAQHSLYSVYVLNKVSNINPVLLQPINSSANLNTMSAPSPTNKLAQDQKPTRQRLPPPTLFQAPPSVPLSHALSHSLPHSPNTSHVSLHATTTNTNTNTTTSPTKSPSTRPPQTQNQHHPTSPSPTTDALWLSMQHTLAEVELTAASAHNLHVFGPQHAAALAQLRGAQIALAQAWARGGGSGDDGEVEDGVVEDTEVPAQELGAGRDTQGGMEGGKGKEGSGTGTGNGNGNGNAAKGRPRRGSKLAEETRSDILLARKRREANDRYFARVSASVGDVVERLEGVAGAMRAVERESRDVWSSGGGESSVGTSLSLSGSGSGSGSAGAGED